MSVTPSHQSVTTSDVARYAGVSQTTVSVVLRGKASERGIAADTAARVLEAARELRYVPNQMARGLRTQRSGMIGVLLANLKWNWAESILNGMLEVFQSDGYTPFVAVHHFDDALAHKELLSCLQRRDEGVVCQPMPTETEMYTRLQRAGVPLIFLGDRPEETSEISFVGWDSGAAARLAVQHLIETGRRRIGFVGIDYPMEMNRGRYAAYASVLEQAGLPRDERCTVIAPMNWPLEHIVRSCMERIFCPGQEHPDAIFCVNDGLALPLLEALGERGVRVPEDLALMGLGDLPGTGHSGVGLTTVKEPVEEMGRQSAQLMLELIADPSRAPIHRLIPGQELKVRRTTAGDGRSLASA